MNFIGKKMDVTFSKKVNSAVLLYCIYVVQVSTGVVIYKLPLVTSSYLFWILIYYVLSLFCSLPQAGFSDMYGRKKHLLISSVSVLLSVFCLFFTYIMNFSQVQLHSFYWSFITAGPTCLILGVMGNFIPIARGGITELKIHNFRAAIGLSTTLIGFGWITAVGLDLVLPDWSIFPVTILLQATTFLAIKYFFHDLEDSAIATTSPSYLKTVLSSYQWFGSMFLVAGGAAAFFAYFFSESTFYPIYSLNEEGVTSFGSKLVGVSMALGYGAGVFLQWIMRCSDKAGIKFGVTISLISLILLVCYEFVFENRLNHVDDRFLVEGILDFLLSLGFGFFVPSLFSLMSSNIQSRHAGRLFGAVDTTDTVALSLSSGILYLKERLKIKEVIIYGLFSLLFLISCFYYRLFVKRFVTYEKRPQREKFTK